MILIIPNNLFQLKFTHQTENKSTSNSNYFTAHVTEVLDSIMRTETWLNRTTLSSGYFPSYLYNVYRKNRKPNSKDKRHIGSHVICILK